jgi:hypothetical protein
MCLADDAVKIMLVVEDVQCLPGGVDVRSNIAQR